MGCTDGMEYGNVAFLFIPSALLVPGPLNGRKQSLIEDGAYLVQCLDSRPTPALVTSKAFRGVCRGTGIGGEGD